MFCNPINVRYPYQFKYDPRDKGRLSVNREAADPSMVWFQGKAYLFASMTGAVWVSEDMEHWESHLLPDNMPIYDYAPDVRVMGDHLYFTASNRGKPCDFYRTKDPLHGPYEKINGSFDFWDPNMFQDDDGRVYFYWGCANSTPIWGVELDKDTLRPISEKAALIHGDPWTRGYERFGENHSEQPRTKQEIDRLFSDFLAQCEKNGSMPPKENYDMIRATFAGMPYIEGAWMTKHDGRYYLQYACPGAEINVYADGVYVSDAPLGPFEPADNNPYSYKPGGFLPGAGHGSTMQDAQGMWWHTSTMRISVNHIFERRVGVWPAGFDAEGNLFCNQRYGDWPMNAGRLRRDPWAEPEWYLLSYGKKMTASSCDEAHPAENAADENVQTWWRAKTNQAGEWLQIDLGESMDVYAVQINFADDSAAQVSCPGAFVTGPDMPRYIDRTPNQTQWLLEGSADGETWQTIADKRAAQTDLSHDFIECKDGSLVRYIRLTIYHVPYGVQPCVSGLRVFGKGNGTAPEQASPILKRICDFDFIVTVPPMPPVTGFNILWGSDEQHLYHSMMVYGNELTTHRIGALVKGHEYTVRVDTFNENGITAGKTMKLQ